MKFLSVIALLYLAVVNPAEAQKTITYACRYIDTVGFVSKDGNWTPTNFQVKKPFFLYAHDGTLQHPKKAIPTLEDPWPLLLYCQQPKETYVGRSEKGEPVQETTQVCGTGFSQLIFNFDSLEGVLTTTYGGIVPPGRQASQPIYMSPFACEQIPQP